MRTSIAMLYELIAGLVPVDDLEAEHRSDTLRWLRGTADVYRRVKPATPARHLVSYVVPIDPADGGVLLVDHVNAGLWLPPGGHVEPNEHPAQTARREAQEELGIIVAAGQPVFLTVTRTTGIDVGHTDVSLWFVVDCARQQQLTVDRREFRAARWWSPAELDVADPAGFDPHFARFRAKLRG